MATPNDVIHVNFIPGPLSFDPRRVWAALQQAERDGKLTANRSSELSAEFGDTPLSIATRYLLTWKAVRNLGKALQAMYALKKPIALAYCSRRQ
jgi:hypothetical protein